TDMPSCSMLIFSMALLALAIFDDHPLRKWHGLTGQHLFLAGFTILVVPQLIYFTANCAHNRWSLPWPGVYLPGWVILGACWLASVAVAAWTRLTARTSRQVYMFWFYAVNALALLAKGPGAPAIAGLTIIFYLAATGDWRLLLSLEIPRGILVGALVGLPWHFAIYLKDGIRWVQEYLGTHVFGRAFAVVFAAAGPSDFFFAPLG